MQYNANSVAEYIQQLPDDRQPIIERLRKLAQQNLPKGFEEQFHYGMITYVVPLSIYPDGYHCEEDMPLPFLSIASQKNHVAIYHMGIYATNELLNWFVDEYNQLEGMNKLDMGKSCIRFKNMNKIPFELLGELFKKIEVEDWISIYEKAYKQK